MKEPFLSEKDAYALRELIARGDQQAFRKLFDTYSSSLAGFSYCIVKDREAAIDIVDRVFVKLWINRDNIQTIRNLTVYLYTATKNTALNHLSGKAQHSINGAFDLSTIQLNTGFTPEDEMISAEMHHKILDAIDSLPTRCKMIFKLVREDGLKYREVADILNISVKTVDAQMVRAIKRISEKVKAHFDSFPAPRQKKI